MRSNEFFRTIALVVGLIVGLTACSFDRDELSDTVRRYCLLLADGYSRLDMSALAHVATTGESNKLEHHMAALAEAQLRMEAALLAIEFQSMTKESADTALVTTREDWKYRYLTVDGAKEVQSNTIHYRARYRLAMIDDRWLVASVDILDTHEDKRLPPLPFLQRPNRKTTSAPTPERR